MTLALAPASLTPEQAVAAAAGLRARLLAEAAETEARTHHSAALHDEFLAAGMYHLLRPRAFGGYALDVTTFARAMRELARGCLSTAWCLCLAGGNNLAAASWWPEAAQRELFAAPYFAAPMVTAPGGTLTPAAGGFLLRSRHPYASGGPFATHLIGQATVDGVLSTFVAPRAAWTRLDDWGHTLGLRGSGSHTLVVDAALLPAEFVLVGQGQLTMDFAAGTPGLRLHGDPMYGGRGIGFFGIQLATLVVGGVRGALDAYAELLVTRTTTRAPITRRVEDEDYRRWFGEAETGLIAAEAVCDRACELFHGFCERAAAGGEPFGYGDDVLVNAVARQSLTMAWQVMQDTVFRTAGSSAAVAGSRLERSWRDLSMAWSHVNSVHRERMFREYTRERFSARTA